MRKKNERIRTKHRRKELSLRDREIKGPLRRPQRCKTYTIEAPKEKPSEIKKRQIKPKNLRPLQRKIYEINKKADKKKMLKGVSKVVDELDRTPKLKRL